MTSVEDFLEDVEEPPPPPNRAWLLAVLVAIVSFVVWILVGDFIGRAQSVPAAQPAVTVTVTATVTAAVGSRAVPASGAPTPTSTVAAAVPTAAVPTAAAPGGTEVLRLSGSGSRTSQTFAVSHAYLRLSYAYDCAAFGSVGAFQVNLQRGSVQVGLLANELGRAGAAVTGGDDGPGIFYLLINSPCAWTVRVGQ